jgi:uncharacterized protein YndB with AHSA1/START domain
MRGHLVLADISGYTRFLSDSELEHANGIIGELLGAIIEAIDAPLEVSRIEGDAVFMYGVVPEGMSGLTVLETVEHTYVAFRGALETMVLNTTCQCNACVNIGSLGLKIVMHCGEFVVTTAGPMTTLSGSDVITAHRLLKNTVRETTGIDDYLLVTQACVDDLDIPRVVESWMPHSESYEDVGEVDGFVTSLADVWEAVKERTVVQVTADEAWMSTSVEIDAPAAVVWDHLVDPAKRTRWLDAEKNDVLGDADGRIGPGAAYHCAHGDNALFVFTVLDRRPMEYLTFLLAPGGGAAIRYTDYLVPGDDGRVRVVSHMAPAISIETGQALDGEGLAELEPLAQGYGELLGNLVELVEAAV